MKETENSEKIKLIKLFNEMVIEKKDDHYKELSIEDLAKKIGLSRTGFYNIPKLSVSDNVCHKMALMLFHEGTWLSVDQKKVVTDYLEASGFKIGAKSKDPQHGLNWYLERFTDTQKVLELYIFLFSEYGLADEEILNDEQKIILKELVSLNFVELNLLGNYKFKKEFGEQFELRNSYNKSLWDIAFSYAEFYRKDQKMTQNFINSDEIKREHLEEVKEIYQDFQNKMNKLIEKTKGSPKKDRELILWGAVFGLMEDKYNSPKD
ncbi:MAG: hypothetical protein OHK0056_22230 [Bacteriovoracaceae bacterium]